MRILIVTAVPLESEVLVAQLEHPSRLYPNLIQGRYAQHVLSVLTTGIGMVNTAYHLGRIFALETFELALNIGVCGAYSRTFQIGEIIHIREEIFSELGAEDNEGNYLDLRELGFAHFVKNEKEYFNRLENPYQLADFFRCDFRKIFSGKSLTVNTVNGDALRIELMRNRFAPDFENMEGGAAALACLSEGLPYFEFRAISNYVEPRNKEAWNIPLACRNIQHFILDLVPQLKFNP
jgi:futalosine hydrolase